MGGLRDLSTLNLLREVSLYTWGPGHDCGDLTDPRVGRSAGPGCSVRVQAPGLGERDGGGPFPERAYPGVGILSHPKVGAEV